MASSYSQLLLLLFFSFGSADQRNVRPVACGSARGSRRLRYVVGDALTDRADCVGPNGEPYPTKEIEILLPQLDVDNKFFLGSRREGRTLFTKQQKRPQADPLSTRQKLLKSYQQLNRLGSVEEAFQRAKREAEDEATSDNTVDDSEKIVEVAKEESLPDCVVPKDSASPARLCPSTFNTTAPMYGVSLTSGQGVTIVQKFPDLLQQVVYETCDSKICDILHGECVQTYIPYLFLVIPLGPVTLTGQDYVLVESGCTCRPKYASQKDPDPMSVIPSF